ncbi:hypothetical protein KKY_216 [Pelagibacterium halotolerans B2]|uniref:Uncharacterized protein n=1 Tax=Pelagibacterium halotolerans (strain DSM 22347 / JCM 15775 / CGMCC 1.7692 / B2) TaxID=1082931 RepID=G4R7W6_PELHB|nr:hypothetical protein KKY_216 [Pelagibacterium halotolerans B2]
MGAATGQYDASSFSRIPGTRPGMTAMDFVPCRATSQACHPGIYSRGPAKGLSANRHTNGTPQ